MPPPTDPTDPILVTVHLAVTVTVRRDVWDRVYGDDDMPPDVRDEPQRIAEELANLVHAAASLVTNHLGPTIEVEDVPGFGSMPDWAPDTVISAVRSPTGGR